MVESFGSLEVEVLMDNQIGLRSDPLRSLEREKMGRNIKNTSKQKKLTFNKKSIQVPDY
jgi:hypothetical protein